VPDTSWLTALTFKINAAGVATAAKFLDPTVPVLPNAVAVDSKGRPIITGTQHDLSGADFGLGLKKGKMWLAALAPL
jgi:hypothetical protein